MGQESASGVDSAEEICIELGDELFISVFPSMLAEEAKDAAEQK